MLKYFSLSGDYGPINAREISKECTFLFREQPILSPSPTLRVCGTNQETAWLVRDLVEGELLMTALENRQPVDKDRVVRDVLDHLVTLEKHQLYHSDLRGWNVLLLPGGGAALIDYGAITEKPEDCIWPRNLILGFFSFIASVCNDGVPPACPRPNPFISPWNLPERYRAWAEAIWAMTPDQWSFALLASELDRIGLSDEEPRSLTALELWMRAIERYLSQLNAYDQALTDAAQKSFQLQLRQTEALQLLSAAQRATEGSEGRVQTGLP